MGQAELQITCQIKVGWLLGMFSEEEEAKTEGVPSRKEDSLMEGGGGKD